MTIDEKYMRRAIQLAMNGRGAVMSNPMVGAVIVHNDRVIGEGYHRKYGGPHAEVNAIRSVEDESLLPESTMYVTLEPCSHYGKTPPCAELIVRKRIPRVVIGCLDPYPEVAGRGVRILQDAGVEVVTGILAKETFGLNRSFMTAHLRKRPYVILKWAQSSDGFIDKIRKDSSTPAVVLSPPDSMRLVHKLRAEVNAIMVGTRTAILDNPSLTVRNWIGDSPVRVVIDKTLKIPLSYNLLNGLVPTLVFTEKEAENRTNVEYVTIDFKREILAQVLAQLYKRKLLSLLVEGGTTLHNQFLKEGLWDEIRMETAAISLHKGVPAPDVRAVLPLDGGEIRGRYKYIYNPDSYLESSSFSV
ncbi:bifunctional diaminohydroxyphosphoribosylaminopyrimidine deaminase/5-amino-6-(5-phosphoribosylamino)uracil reductase RibD [Massilibacteroides sp.]|uniref:bifunctional diaminohydroxyphosphoribosylaminopyrimidine deaminase/5-amino-6-(5-phosphoribosylamino)uracil reductase RibD n=1 Tax=Massilibacteroides sp. TaxID=2034766 RepID=UPI002623942C|nr:bifunctional diaminohydroxyphosphoribosylaminopyrimidine deaminase/5-amino-6-(5-phosphoribosylamino)uracil reductase RibD [Massilibacteroides sp.]MDD4514865.1 bifunctional diaminohydroxyphosphoribosylaminopyrimidine deaminase/5-amino-6-(5-phosphoribosylamino)uracil reductase RibD [Massilibacteroides sp.]